MKDILATLFTTLFLIIFLIWFVAFALGGAEIICWMFTGDFFHFIDSPEIF